MTTRHVPVMPEAVLAWLAPAPGDVFVDGTLGGGGHARLLAERVHPGGRVIGCDRDAAALERAAPAIRGLPVEPIAASYHRLPEVLEVLGCGPVDGVLLDLGLSSDQLEDRDRGFSFQSDGPLDLRFDTDHGEPAADLLARLPEAEIARILYEWGEERKSRRIARRIVERRRARPLRTAAELADLVRSCVPRSRANPIDPATRTFQALRIAVNDELGILRRAMAVVPDCLKAGGRLVVISFHSLEDRIVKHALREDDRMRVLTKKPVLAGEEETAANPRSRSAKLRAAQRVSGGAG